MYLSAMLTLPGQPYLDAGKHYVLLNTLKIFLHNISYNCLSILYIKNAYTLKSSIQLYYMVLKNM